jgi:hypothetical protein
MHGSGIMVMDKCECGLLLLAAPEFIPVASSPSVWVARRFWFAFAPEY